MALKEAALVQTILATLQAAVGTLLFLVNRGFVSPVEVEAYIDSICEVIRYDSPHSAPHDEQTQLFRDLFEARLLPLFAQLKESAAQNWKG